MEIKNLIKKSLIEEAIFTRCKYQPYSIEVAIRVWDEILGRIVNAKPKYTQASAAVFRNAIMYAHGDESGLFDINKALFIYGNTGSGKTVFFQTLKQYMAIDGVKILRAGQLCRFDYNTYNARDIVASYATSGFDGLYKYTNNLNILIDDLGTESKDARYFGTQLNCIEEIVEQRYLKQYFTHFSSNLVMEGENSILSRYGERVYSRLKQTCNFIELAGEDFRITNNPK